MSKKSKATQEVIRLLKDDPLNWSQGKYTIRHKSGIELWTGSCFFLCGIFNPERKTSLIDKFFIQRAINQWHRTVGVGVKDESTN